MSIFAAFVCSVPGCDRTFSVLSNMRRHTKTHSSPFSTSPLQAPSSNPPEQSKASVTMNQNVDDELIDELEDISAEDLQFPSNPSTPHSRSEDSRKRRRVRDYSQSATAIGRPPKSSLEYPAGAPPSIPSLGDGADDLDELLGEGGSSRQGRSHYQIQSQQRGWNRGSHQSHVYTSSEESDGEAK